MIDNQIWEIVYYETTQAKSPVWTLIKKTQKTEPKEIKIATNRLREYRSRIN